MTAGGRSLIAGNWKMHGLLADGVALARGIADRARAALPPGSASLPTADILLCPPTTLLAAVGASLAGSPVWLGGQDCHPAASGAFTGDISAPMLKDIGCGWVIVGHSERRGGHHETDGLVRAKAAAAIECGLRVILCVGETDAERTAGHARDIVARQVAASVPPSATPTSLVVAYEPVWAIGSGRTPTSDEIATVHGHLRSQLSGMMDGGDAVRLLYGGSVKPSNARELLALADVDGALVGGASLKAADFWAIVDAVPPAKSEAV